MSVAVEVSGDAALEPLVTRAVQAACAHLDVSEAAISVALLDDAEITALNREYLQHDRVTDVISFPLWEEGELVVGDIYIGVQQARRQAEEVGIAFEEELTRLCVHGTLHVLHYDHPEDESRVESEMWTLQEQILGSLAE